MITKELSIVIDNHISQIHRVEAFIEQICDEYNVYNNYYSNILVSVSEAFSNAVIYGNSGDITKKIKLEFKSTSNGLVFSIQDEGVGFDFVNVPDPTNIASKNDQIGRGIYLIKHLSDEVSFLNNGSRIEMLFKVSSINYETSLNRANLFKEYISQSVKENVSNE